MTMYSITKPISTDDLMTIEELNEMINNDDLHIVFGDTIYEYLLEFDLRFKGDNKRVIMIRNKYNDGTNSRPIPHEPSLKYIFKNHYSYDGISGIPFNINQEFDGELTFQGNAAKTWKLSDIDKTGKKIVKTILKEDSKIIYEYWYLNPQIQSECERMKQIEYELTLKYSKMRF